APLGHQVHADQRGKLAGEPPARHYDHQRGDQLFGGVGAESRITNHESRGAPPLGSPLRGGRRTNHRTTGTTIPPAQREEDVTSVRRRNMRQTSSSLPHKGWTSGR